MAVYGIVFEKHRDIGQKTPIFHTILPINLHDHIELRFSPKKLIQTVRVPIGY